MQCDSRQVICEPKEKHLLKGNFSLFLYSNKNTKAPTRNKVIGNLFNIALSLALYKPMGVFGVTFASSLSELLTGILNIISAKKINNHISIEPWIVNLKYWGVGSVLCVAATIGFQYFTADWTSSIIRFGCCTLIGFAVYSIPCYKLIKNYASAALGKNKSAR